MSRKYIMQNQISNISPNHPITSSPSEARLPWLDFASGIMILWMIIYHALQASWGYEVRDLWGITDASLLPKGIHAFINSEGKLEVLNPCVVFLWLHFFMPWFFYKSGQFFKKNSITDNLKKDSRKLLKAFLIWSTVGYVFFLVFGLIDGSLNFKSATYSIVRNLLLNGQIPINGPCWFLLSLFGVRQVANILLPQRGSKCFIFGLMGVVLISYFFAFFANRFNNDLLPYWIGNGIAGLCYFSLGYALKDRESNSCVIVLSVLVTVSFGVFGFPMVNMFYNKLFSGNFYLLWIPVSLCCIITFNALCKLLNEFVRVKIIENIGRNALTILVTHCLIYLTIAKVFSYCTIELSHVVMFSAIILSYILILPVCCVLKNNIVQKEKLL